MLGFVALLLPAAAALAQQQEPTVQLAGWTGEDWPTAQAVVTVLDGDDRTVAGLTETSFLAQLDALPVPIVDVTQGVDSSLPIAVVLAMDVSGSMEEGGALDQAKLAARSFLDGLAPEDSVAVLTFNDTVDVVQPFTQDREAAAAAIDGLTAAGATALYQATDESVRLAAEAESSRRVVVLLSDGRDHGSVLSRTDALTAAETLGVPVFTIGLGADIDRGYLQALATVSEGRFADTPSPEGLAQLYQEAGELLRGQYVLTLDATDLALVESEAVTLRVETTIGGRTGNAERTVCPQTLCVALSGLVPGERPEEPRTVVADVVSEDPVASVTFLVDGEPVLELGQPPYEYTFDPASLPDGEHTLAVQATSSAGETEALEVAVRVGATGGGGISSTVLLVGVIAVAAVGVALLLVLLRRRRGGAEEELVAGLGPQPPSDGSDKERPGRPLWEDGPPLPPLPLEEAQGWLQVTGGPSVGERFPVGGAPASIGSGHRCLIRLAESLEEGQEIASEYARVWVRDGQLMMHEVRRLTEAGAMGGRWAILSPGDVFTIGPYTFRFELAVDEAAEPAGDGERPPDVPDILRCHPADRSDDDGPDDDGPDDDGPEDAPVPAGEPASREAPDPVAGSGAEDVP